MKKLKEHIDKAGIAGVVFSHLCCIGLGARIGFITPTFLPFFMNHRILLPFLLLSLVASNLGVFFSYLKHKNILPFLISIISSTVIVVFSFFVHVGMLLYIGLVGLIGASIYNMIYSKKSKK